LSTFRYEFPVESKAIVLFRISLEEGREEDREKEKESRFNCKLQRALTLMTV